MAKVSQHSESSESPSPGDEDGSSGADFFFFFPMKDAIHFPPGPYSALYKQALYQQTKLEKLKYGCN